MLPSDENILQDEIELLVKYAEDHFMKINKEKNKVMMFNNSRKVDVTPRLTIGDEVINVTEETKLFGIMLRSDMKWSSHVNYLATKYYKRMWMLRNLITRGNPVRKN